MNETKSKPFIKTPFLSQLLNIFDYLREKNKSFGEASCVLITGESGCGKSELAKQYLKQYPSYEEPERTVIPVLHFELRAVSTPVEFLRAILIAMKDPQNGEGRNAGVLFERFIVLSKVVGIELIILDEIQVIIERRSQKVVTGLADLFKDLIKETGIPIVFMGMPWSEYLINSNPQLGGRVAYRYTISPYKVSDSTGFTNYRKLLKALSNHYRFPGALKLESKETAYRMFAFSEGNMRQTIRVIHDAYIKSVIAKSDVDLSLFSEVVSEYGLPRDRNAFSLPLNQLIIREMISHSDWKFGTSANKNAILEAEFCNFKLSDDLRVISLLA